MRHRQMIPSKYSKNKVLKAIIYVLFALYIFYFFGFKFSINMFTGQMREIQHAQAGFSIQLPPFWAYYKSGQHGRKEHQYERLSFNAINQAGGGIDQMFSDSPSLENAISWYGEEHSINFQSVPPFQEIDLNSYPAFISSKRTNDETRRIVVVLGIKNEYVLNFVSKSSMADEIVKEILDSFMIKDGY